MLLYFLESNFMRSLIIFSFILLYKIINNLSPVIVQDTFRVNREAFYNLRCNNEFQTINVRTVRYGTESLSFLANKIWSIIPIDIKNAPTLKLFKEKIKLWRTNNCPCRLCKTYVQQVGFI